MLLCFVFKRTVLQDLQNSYLGLSLEIYQNLPTCNVIIFGEGILIQVPSLLQFCHKALSCLYFNASHALILER